MRILALYDIHGNPDALDAVLADPRSQDADVVVVGGDAVPGPFSQAVLDRLELLTVPIHWVRGNGEREVAAAASGADPDPRDVPAATAALAAGEIGVERARLLGDLPLEVYVDGVLFCHASPRSDEEMLTRLTSDADWVKALGNPSVGLVVGGHTHQQDDRLVGETRFINAGSVGMPYEGDGAARWLWIEDHNPHLLATAYDSVATGKRALAAGWPDTDSIEAALIEPVPAIEITRLFEQTRRPHA
jgi:predicted phosphodiesterase